MKPGGQLRAYSLYGLSVQSEIPLTFPERTLRDRADVTFSFASEAWFAEVTGGIPGRGDCESWYDHRRYPDGSDFLHFPDLFEFVISADGRTVSCRELRNSTVESFQTYLLGHVLSYAMVKQGYEPLHATTVVVDGRAVAFLGASGQGKSTLAAAFLQAGHQILTDDLLLIDGIGGRFCGFPGPPRIKLFPSIARHFLPKLAPAAPMNPDSAKLIVPLADRQMAAQPAPLQVFFALDEGSPERGTRISVPSGTDAVLELLGSTFNKRIVNSERLRRQFVAAREWAALIPIRRLEYVRALDNVDEVCHAIVSHVAGLPS
jgi:hypothetical protein